MCYDMLSNRNEWWVPGKLVDIRQRLEPYWRVSRLPETAGLPCCSACDLLPLVNAFQADGRSASCAFLPSCFSGCLCRLLAAVQSLSCLSGCHHCQPGTS